MNLVGKIFIVLIFVMSLLWMGFSVAVYATHENWKDYVENATPTAEKPLGLKPQLEQAKAENDRLKDQLQRLGAELAAANTAKRQALTKLEQEKADLARQLSAQEKQYTDLVQSENDAQANLKATQELAAALRAEVVDLRNQIAQAQKARDDAHDEVVKLTDALHQRKLEYDSLKTRTDQLASELADARTVLDKHGLKPVPALYEKVPFDVEGRVLEVRGNGMVEISIGSDEGLIKGHQLHVIRQSGGTSAYLGRVEVMETEPDKAVCKVLPEFLQGPIQRNDIVRSKLQ